MPEKSGNGQGAASRQSGRRHPPRFFGGCCHRFREDASESAFRARRIIAALVIAQRGGVSVQQEAIQAAKSLTTVKDGRSTKTFNGGVATQNPCLRYLDGHVERRQLLRAGSRRLTVKHSDRRNESNEVVVNGRLRQSSVSSNR